VLVSLYVEPPAVAGKQPPPQPKPRTAALCETVEVAYRKRVAANEAAMGTDSSTYTQSLFAFLSQDPHSNVRRASADEDLNVGSGQGFDAWARGQSPPITFSKQVRRELGEFEDTSFRMSRAPGTDYYVASQVNDDVQDLAPNHRDPLALRPPPLKVQAAQHIAHRPRVVRLHKDARQAGLVRALAVPQLAERAALVVKATRRREDQAGEGRGRLLHVRSVARSAAAVTRCRAARPPSRGAAQRGLFGERARVHTAVP